MKEKEILNSLKNTIENAPIDLLDKIKVEPRVKMMRHDDITRQKNFTLLAKKIIPYASIAAVFFAVFLNWQLSAIAMDSRIYLDINPSISIETNKQDKVIELIAGNDDGGKLIESVDYKGKSMYLVTEMLLQKMIEQGFIEDPEEFLLLSVYNKDKDKAELQKATLDQSIHGYLEGKSIMPIVLTQSIVNSTTIEKYADEYNVSVSMMTFIRNLMILDPDLDIDQLAGLNLEELVKMSQGMGLELDKIIDSKDIERINPVVEPINEPVDYDDDDDDYDDDIDEMESEDIDDEDDNDELDIDNDDSDDDDDDYDDDIDEMESEDIDDEDDNDELDIDNDDSDDDEYDDDDDYESDDDEIDDEIDDDETYDGEADDDGTDDDEADDDEMNDD